MVKVEWQGRECLFLQSCVSRCAYFWLTERHLHNMTAREVGCLTCLNYLGKWRIQRDGTETRLGWPRRMTNIARHVPVRDLFIVVALLVHKTETEWRR